MKIYNTLTEQKEELKKPLFRKLKLFVCGPTVYDAPHIGNARTFVAFDIIVRYLRSRDFKIFYLQNITNIDDKIIQRAREKNTTWDTVADQYEQVFYDDTTQLHITSVDRFARATDFIPQIVSQVKRLIKKGHAYKIDGDLPTGQAGGWYFDLTTYSDYGQLARRTVAQAEDGVSRIDASSKKRNVGDFCLWKFTSPENKEEPSWESELGAGRPGWHIEDTAITEHFFGVQYDIHGGALDLKFPHHEAERAQQESASGKKPFVKLWMHAGFLTVNGQKMSKSLGNFLTIEDLLKKNTADEFRMMLLMHHYRQPLDYSDPLIYQARKNLTDISTFLLKLKLIKNTNSALEIDIARFTDQYHKAFEDDLNTPRALAAIFNLMNEAHKDFWKLSLSQAREIGEFIASSFKTLGFVRLIPEIPAEITQLAQKRELSRTSKQFAQADDLRRQIESLGYIVEDTPHGPLVLPKQQG